MITVLRLTRRYILEYVRRPVNIVLLIFVPLIFVILSAGAIIDFAKAVGFVGAAGKLSAPTAGWAASFLAGIAGFYQILNSRDADKRLALSGMGVHRIVISRIFSGLLLSLLAALASISALAIKSEIVDPLRIITGTLLSVIIYLGIGVAVGSVAKREINGSLIVIFIWMFDVFLGPAMAGGKIWITRLFPSHFVTLLMLNRGSGHKDFIGNFGWSMVWAVGALLLAVVIFSANNASKKNQNLVKREWAVWHRLCSGFKYGLRDYRRNVILWVLLLLLPIAFITLSFYVTPAKPVPVELLENGITKMKIITLDKIHGAIMVPITLAFLAGLSGLFIVQGSMEADARLVLAGFRPFEILFSRIGTIVMAALLTTVVSIGITAINFTPENWGWFIGGNLLVAFTYGMIGVLIGVIFGRIGGLYMMFLLPFIDVGIAQNIMFSISPPKWGSVLPSRGGVRILVDAAFTKEFDYPGSLILALVWLVCLIVVTSIIFRQIAKPKNA